MKKWHFVPLQSETNLFVLNEWKECIWNTFLFTLYRLRLLNKHSLVPCCATFLYSVSTKQYKVLAVMPIYSSMLISFSKFWTLKIPVQTLLQGHHNEYILTRKKLSSVVLYNHIAFCSKKFQEHTLESALSNLWAGPHSPTVTATGHMVWAAYRLTEMSSDIIKS